MPKPHRQRFTHASLTFKLLSSTLALLVCGLCHAQSELPSLDTDMTPDSARITPITDLTGALDLSTPTPKTAPAPTPVEEVPVDAAPAEASPEEQPSLRLEPASLPAEIKPEAQQATKPKFPFSLNPFQDDKAMKPISYSPLPGIAIFPVIKHGNERAFGDLALIFAREYAQRLELKVPETKVYHPIYTVDELRMQGMGHVYDQVMKYYIKAGRPEPAAIDYLIKRLSENGRTVSRVIFVEADLDISHPGEASSFTERIHAMMTDSTPKQMRYFINSRLQIFDAENPEFPMVWGGSWRRSIKTSQFLNVTPSVYADSDSQQAFAKTSREMSREVLFITPKTAYMAPIYDMSVQGDLVSKNEKTMPNFTDMPSSSAEHNINNDNRQAIQRILQRQNNTSP